MARKTLRVAARRQRTIYLPEPLDRKIRLRAAQFDSTISDVIAEVLRAYFAAEREASKKPRISSAKDA